MAHLKDHKLWQIYKDWKENYRWVDLTHPLSPKTPHWVGWDILQIQEQMNLDESIFAAHLYTVTGQYGTHVDAPNHMVKNARALHEITVEEMVYPLCVIDCSLQVAENPDFILTVADIQKWENMHGPIPKGAFVVFQSNWSKRPAEEMDNLDADGNRHFPGWQLEAVKFLVEERNIGGIGHETSDTDSPLTSKETNYAVEHYILSQNRIQVELLTNIDACPPTGALIFCTFPKVKNGTGFPCRAFALCPK